MRCRIAKTKRHATPTLAPPYKPTCGVLRSRTQIIADSNPIDPGQISPAAPTLPTLANVPLGEVYKRPVRVLAGRDGQYSVGTVWTVTGKDGEL